MKTLLFLMMTVMLSVCIRSQVPNFPPNIYVLDTTVDCHAGMVFATLEIDNLTDGNFYFDYLDTNNVWTNAGFNIPSNGDIGVIDITFSGIGLIMHEYDSARFGYYHIPNGDSVLLATVALCPSAPGTGIDSYNLQKDIISYEYYTLSGTPIKDITISGIYVQRYVLRDGRIGWRKIGIMI